MSVVVSPSPSAWRMNESSDSERLVCLGRHAAIARESVDEGNQAVDVDVGEAARSVAELDRLGGLAVPLGVDELVAVVGEARDRVGAGRDDQGVVVEARERERAPRRSRCAEPRRRPPSPS